VFLSRLVKLNVDSNRRARDEENKRKIVKRNGRFKARKTNPHFSLRFKALTKRLSLPAGLQLGRSQTADVHRKAACRPSRRSSGEKKFHFF